VIREQFRLLAKTRSHGAVSTSPDFQPSASHEAKQINVTQLMHGYRARGHVMANIDPLKLNSIEKPQLLNHYSKQAKLRILERLTAAEGLEKHLDSKYPGTKRFGLEGGESFIPMLDGLIKRAGTYGAKEIVLGMAHRGRLNTLVNVFGKNPSDLFDKWVLLLITQRMRARHLTVPTSLNF